jgi:hypothetical protein
MNPLVQTCVIQAQLLFQLPLLQWQNDSPLQNDVEEFKRQTDESVFDPLLLRASVWKDLEEGRSVMRCKQCPLARVLWIQPKNKKVEPDWSTWTRVFQWYGKPNDGTQWRIFWFPSELKRTAPEPGLAVGPAHINGGYTIPCTSSAIVIYRREEATRVLLHEMSHAACLDDQSEALVMREARTETWAEIFLVAIKSEGSLQKAERLWKFQTQWIADQNDFLRRKHGVQGPNNYAWRYTIAREIILNQLRIHLPAPRSFSSKSLRFTHITLCS